MTVIFLTVKMWGVGVVPGFYRGNFLENAWHRLSKKQLCCLASVYIWGGIKQQHPFHMAVHGINTVS